MCFSIHLNKSFSLKDYLVWNFVSNMLYFLLCGAMDFAAHMMARIAIQRSSTENIIYLLNTSTKQIGI